MKFNKKIGLLLIGILFPMLVEAEVTVKFPEKIEDNTKVSVVEKNYKFYYQWVKYGEINTNKIEELKKENEEKEKNIQDLTKSKKEAISSIEIEIDNIGDQIREYEAQNVQFDMEINTLSMGITELTADLNEKIDGLYSKLANTSVSCNINIEQLINGNNASLNICKDTINNQKSAYEAQIGSLSGNEYNEYMLMISYLNEALSYINDLEKWLPNVQMTFIESNSAITQFDILKQENISKIRNINLQITSKQEQINQLTTTYDNSISEINKKIQANKDIIKSLQNINNYDENKWIESNDDIVSKNPFDNTAILWVKIIDGKSETKYYSNKYTVNSNSDVNNNNNTNNNNNNNNNNNTNTDSNINVNSKTEKIKSDDGKISVYYNNGEVNVGTILSTKKVDENSEEYKKIQNKLTDVKKMEVYDINLLSNNQKVQPNGKVILEFEIPKGFDANKIIVYRVEDDFALTELRHTISDGKILVETDHFSYYVIAEKPEKSGITNPQTGALVSISIIIIGAFTAGGIYLYTKNKRKFIRL